MKVGVDLEGLPAFRKRLRSFSQKEVKRAVYGTLDEVAEDANRRLAKAFERHIEGGPVAFTQIRPGERKSSVVNNRARRNGSGGVSSEIRVQSKQAKYLRYVLGEDEVRTPGEAGFSTKYNLIPTGTAHQIKKFRVEKDAHGNLSRASFRRLFREAYSQRKKDFESLKEKAGGVDPTREQFDAFRGQRKKDRRLKRVDARVGATKKQEVFFGTMGKKRTLGFWNRPADRSHKPSLIVLAVKRSRYSRDYLVPHWNDAVRQAMVEMPRTLQRRLEAQLANRGG